MGRIEATELESFVRSLVESWDTPPDVAADVAASLAGADERGVDRPLVGRVHPGDGEREGLAD